MMGMFDSVGGIGQEEMVCIWGQINRNNDEDLILVKTKNIFLFTKAVCDIFLNPTRQQYI